MKRKKPSYSQLEQRIKELEAIVSSSVADKSVLYSEGTDSVIKNKPVSDNFLIQSILEDLLAGYWDWDMVNHTEYLSPNFKKMFGYKDHELPNLPESWQKLIFPDDLKVLLDNLDKYIKTHGAIPFYNEIRFRHKNGYTVWVICVGRVIEWQPDGLPKRMVGCHIDITNQKQAEGNLKVMAAMLDIAPSSITVHDFSGNFLYANQKTFEIHGYNKNEFMALNLHELDIPESASMIDERMQLIKEKGEASFEVSHFKKDGTIVPLEVYVTQVEWHGIPAMLSSATDISQRRQTEDKLREKDLIFEAFMEHSPVYVFFKDQNIRTLHLSRNYEKMLGMPLENILGKSMAELFPSELAKNMVEDDKKILMEGKLVQVDENLNGRYYTTLKFPIKLENKPPMLAGFTIDITDRKLAEEALQQSEYFLQKSQSVAHIGSYYFNALSGNWMSSHALDEIFGIDGNFTKNVEGWISVIHPDYKDEMLHYFNQHVIVGHNRFDKEYKIVRLNDKQIRWVHGLGELEFDEKGNTTKMIGTIQDITERKKVEEELLKAKEKAEESDRLKTAFLQNISHEIRTPMNAIVGFSELLALNYNNKEKLLKFSGIINHRCNDLLDIINEILDIAKIESGQLSLHMEPYNLKSLFEDIKDFFDHYSEKINKQHIKFNISDRCLPVALNIISDSVKLRQIFINLITNAYKFTSEGTITTGCNIVDKNKLVFYVSDTGIGIPKEKHSLIFERFTQVDYEINRIYSGTGLGLSIVKGLIDLLGGEIWLDSEPGKGSTFYFSIPYQTTHTDEIKKHKVIQGLDNMHSTGTVLIVEDDIYNSEYLKEILKLSGLNLIFTCYGKDAIEIVKKQSIDIILMDIRLPDTNGYEVIRQIKENNQQIKIIAQTAFAGPSDQKQALQAGCDDYISKPIKKDILLSKIKLHLMGE